MGAFLRRLIWYAFVHAHMHTERLVRDEGGSIHAHAHAHIYICIHTHIHKHLVRDKGLRPDEAQRRLVPREAWAVVEVAVGHETLPLLQRQPPPRTRLALLVVAERVELEDAAKVLLVRREEVVRVAPG